MNWRIGQKVIALYDISVYTKEGVWVEHLIRKDMKYRISDIKPACCMNLLDVGKTFRGMGTKIIYTCKKCKKEYSFDVNEIIYFNEKWFRPLDDNESMIAKAMRVMADLLTGHKKNGRQFIRIKSPMIIPHSDPAPMPLHEPKREKIVIPLREEERI